MRVVKVVEYGIHAVVISGAFVLLGGVAFADSTTTTPVPGNTQSSNQVPGKFDGTGNTTTTNQGVVTQVDNTNTTTTGDSNSQSNTTNITNTTNDNQTGSGSSGISGTDPTVTSTSQQNSQVTGGTSPQDSNQSGTGSAPTAQVANDQDQPEAVATNSVTTPDLKAQPVQQQAAPVVVVLSHFLQVQPVMMSTPSVSDLGANLPTLPQPVSAPLPPKPNSALGHLTANLTATVVPFFLLITGKLAGQAPLALMLFAGLFFLISAFIFTYGLWLRRGGFATAARSDAPTLGAIFLPFATPHFLGYVFAPPRLLHNPVFVVAEIKSARVSRGSYV